MSVIQDLRFSFRMWRRSPGLTAAVLVTMAVTIGSTILVLTIVHRALLSPLPLGHPEQLMLLSSKLEELGPDRFWVSGPEVLEMQAHLSSFESIGAWRDTAVNVGGIDAPARARAALATAGLLETLGVEPLHGRMISQAECQAASPVVMLSHSLWQRISGGDVGMVDQSLVINGRLTKVVGIMPPGADLLGRDIELWLPHDIDPARPGDWSTHVYLVLARLRPEMTFEQAAAELSDLVGRLHQEGGPETHRPSPDRHPLVMRSLHEETVGALRSPMLILVGAVTLLLVIASANAAGLLLVQAEARRAEIALRSAIGARPSRLTRQLVTEGLCLALTGGILGLWLAALSGQLLAADLAQALPSMQDASIQPMAALAGLGIALLAGLAFGLVSRLHLRSLDLRGELGSSSTHMTPGAARVRARRFLVGLEVALAIVLVIASGLLVRSYARLAGQNLGLEPDRLLTFRVSLTPSRYPDAVAISAFMNELAEILRHFPGVTSAAAMSGLPLQREIDGHHIEIEATRASHDGGDRHIDYYQFITSHYFETMGIKLIEGRLNDERDQSQALPVVLINQKAADVLFPGESPLGKRLRFGGGCCPWRSIVGVVDNVKQGGLGSPVGTEIYHPISQSPGNLPPPPFAFSVAARSPLSTSSLVPMLREAVAEIDPALPIAEIQPMADIIERGLGGPRLIALLVTCSAAASLLLAMIGTHGLISFAMTTRTKEIGIRVALGAHSSQVVFEVIRQELRAVVCGAALGILGSLVLSYRLSSELYEITAIEAWIQVGLTSSLLLAAIGACIVPASRAAAVDPASALRAS